MARLAWISFLGCVVVILQTSPFETEARRREEGGGRRECQRDYVRECADASTCRHRLDARRAYKACV